jgi:hypothetical protein
VIGNVTYTNDFGDPRPGGSHEGNDIMTRRHQPAIAFEGGRVQKHVGSSLGTCMLYLHGKSGMTYVYIHLNNDLGPTNDNDGGCRNGVSWPKGLQNGDYVRRGELVGYVGDSGDADGIQPHLHFEIRTPSGRAINPYTYLRESKPLLYPRPATNNDITLVFRKSTILDVSDGRVRIRTRTIVRGSLLYPYTRRLGLELPPEAVVERRTSSGPERMASLTRSSEGQRARVWTVAFRPSWETQLGLAGVLAVDRILIGDPG